MKQSLLSLMLLVGGISASGQQLYPLKSVEDSLPFKILVKNRQLVLEPQSETGLFQKKKDFQTIVSVGIEEADLVVHYQPGKLKDELKHDITLRLKMPDGQVVVPQPHELLYSVDGDHAAARLVWLDATERMDDFEGIYMLYVHHSLMGAVNCEGLRPAFSLKKQLPHYAAGVAGLALVGLGQVYRAQKNDYYDTYQRLWAEGEPAPSDDGNNPLNKALDKDKASKICTWTGVGILAADALLFVYRHSKIKRKQGLYDKFCGQKTSLLFEPSLQFANGIAAGAPTPGIRVSLSF